MTGRRVVLFSGVGGQGVLSAARFLGEAAHRAGLMVTVSQLHGMSQRGGAVQAAVTLGSDKPLNRAQEPVDLLVGLELFESLRMLHRLDQHSLVLANRLLLPPPGASGLPTPEQICSALKERAGSVFLLEATALAQQAGLASALSTAMLGAACGLPGIPVPKEALLETIRQRCSPGTWEGNRLAFELGHQALSSLHGA